MCKPQITLLIFDIDGTLTDTQEVDDQCFITAFQDEFKVTLTKTDWTTFTHVTDSGLFTELFRSVFAIQHSEREKQDFQQRFLSYLVAESKINQERFKPVKGAGDFIQYCIEQRNYKIAFATGGWSHSAKLKLQAADVFHRDIPLVSCDFHFRRQDILLEAIEQSEKYYNTTTFDAIVYFGDGEWDYKTTTELGIPFKGIDINSDKKLKGFAVQNILSDFVDMENNFETIRKATTANSALPKVALLIKAQQHNIIKLLC